MKQEVKKTRWIEKVSDKEKDNLHIWILLINSFSSIKTNFG